MRTLALILIAASCAWGQSNPVIQVVAVVPLATGPTPVFSDGFEAGSAVGWTSHNGTVRSYALFGFAAPTGGGTYGDSMYAQANYASYNVTDGKEYWHTFWVRTPDLTSDYAQITQVRETGDSELWHLMITDAGKLRGWNQAGSAATALGSSTLSINTWYKIKVHTKIATTSTGVIQVWLWTGSAWNAEINETDENLGTGNIDTIDMGHRNDSSTPRIYDIFSIYSEDPG